MVCRCRCANPLMSVEDASSKPDLYRVRSQKSKVERRRRSRRKGLKGGGGKAAG